MKLAEALALRSEMQAKIDSIQARILRNLKIQEGEAPHEDPNALMSEMRGLYDRHCSLVQQINARNNVTRLPDGRTLSEALSVREALLKRRNMLSSIVSKATEREHRLSHAEVKFYVTISVSAVQKEVDDLSRAHRELDMLIQGVNWTVDL